MNPNDIRTDLEDELSEFEPPYRSRQEVQLGRMLDKYGIPFFYDQPMLVYDNGNHKIVKPAFTLPTYAGLVMEYAANAADIHRRQRVYQDNGIAAVIVQPKDLQSFEGPANLLNRIEQAAQQYRIFRKYPTRSVALPMRSRYSPHR